MGARGPKVGSTQLGRPFAAALNLAINRVATDPGPDKGKVKLAIIADKLVKRAVEGHMDAIQEVANRLDGRPAQQIHTVDDDGNPAPTGLAIVFVESKEHGA